ncbi:unnamed protein product [Mytilus coruscus]|uniref:Reverse transcriptase domain-containing protein n=1 Tax=Mytilus coruscus TaxID=42192 RepID=A0A6J8BB88_MYTCO|nr:unnamed protein product [Mytilus coruscus]
MEALALLEGEDLQKTKIPIGQQKLLLKSIRQSFKTETENAPKSSNGGLPACPTIEDACAPEVTVSQDGGNNNKNNHTSGLTDTCVGNVSNQLQQQQSAAGVINQGCGQRHSGSGHQSSFQKKKRIGPVKPLRDLHLDAWVTELMNDFDKEYLLQGIEFGFDIVTSAANELPSGIVGKNHPSASPNNPLYKKAHLQILNEIECGNYVFAEKTPRIISPLAVIPKPDGGVRIIHDCSRPEGSAVNSFVGEIEKQRFQTLDEASKLVTPNCYMDKVDLKTAYRSVNLSSQSQEVTGLKWTFPDGTEYTFHDTKLPFGSKLAPHIHVFHRLSQAVRRMMSRRGFTIIAYLDDFFICETTKQRCIQALNILLALLRKLGFMINWSKVVDPTTKLTFLGIEIDSTAMELRLPGEKLSLLKHELAEFNKRKRASKKQLQSIAGKLNWASAVVHGGREFLRRIIDAITPLKHDWHTAILHGEIWHDIEWWKKFLETFNGKSLILEKIPLSSLYTDACKERGGGFFGCDWFYTNWENDFPLAKNLHINELEALTVVLAAQR